MDLSWFEHSPVSLVIDTSSLISERFDFSSKKMTTVKQSVKNGDFQVLTTIIFKGEFLKHCRAEASDELEKIEKFGLLRNMNSEHLAANVNYLKNFSAEVLWKTYCEDLNVKDISSDIDWRTVFEDYFSFRAPFSEKKKNEFADAFNIKMLEKLRPSRLVIISSDPDYDAWSKGKTTTHVFRNVQEFTNEYTRLKDPEFIGVTDKAITEFVSEIEKEMESAYAEPEHYSIDSFHSEIVSADVRNISLKKKFVIAVSRSEGFATYRLVFNGNSKLEIESAVVAYDSIDKEEITQGYNKNSADVDFTAYADVTVLVHDSENIEYTIDDTSFEASEVDVRHEWESFLEE